jgi:hypothetical protein
MHICVRLSIGRNNDDDDGGGDGGGDDDDDKLNCRLLQQHWRRLIANYLHHSPIANLRIISHTVQILGGQQFGLSYSRSTPDQQHET